MNLLRYFFIVTICLCINYAIAFFLLTWALIRGYYLPGDYLQSLVLIADIFLFVGFAFNVFTNLSYGQAKSFNKRINAYSAFVGLTIIVFTCLYFDIGLYMDVSNKGLADSSGLDIYFLIYHIFLGLQLSPLFEKLISRIQKTENKNI